MVKYLQQYMSPIFWYVGLITFYGCPIRTMRTLKGFWYFSECSTTLLLAPHVKKIGDVLPCLYFWILNGVINLLIHIKFQWICIKLLWLSYHEILLPTSFATFYHDLDRFLLKQFTICRCKYWITQWKTTMIYA